MHPPAPIAEDSSSRKKLRRASSTPDVEKIVQKKGSRIFTDGPGGAFPSIPETQSVETDEAPKKPRCALCKLCCRTVGRFLCCIPWCFIQLVTCRWRLLFSSCADTCLGNLLEKLSEHVFYMLDRAFATRGSQAVMMVALGLLEVASGGTLYMLVWRYSDWEDPRGKEEVYPILEGFWHTWTFMADPGTHAPAWGPYQRLVAALVTIGGIVFFASVLGLTVDIIREKMDNLRKGKSKIIEDDHTLVLGWTQQTVHIIEELCNANESEGGGCVAVLALESKEFMESELATALPLRRRLGTRIVIRSGSPLLMTDLLRVSAHNAKAIVIHATAGAQPNEADANTVRTVLSLRTVFGSSMQGHIVAEVRDIDNEPLLRTVSDNSVEIVVSHDMIGRLMLMSVRQPGLAKVYEALLGFEGDEFYIDEWPELVGCRFGDLQLYFPDAIPIGVFSDDECCLKPDGDRIMAPGDELVVIAQDNDSYKPETRYTGGLTGDPPSRPPITIENEKILICGWRRDVRDILKQLDKIVNYGTEVHMITHCVPISQREQVLHEDGFDIGELQNIALVHHYGNTSVRRQLDKLPMETYTSCMIFADQAFEHDSMYADSHSLATLLLMRDIQCTRKMGYTGSTKSEAAKSAVERLTNNFEMSGVMASCPVVCEVLAPQTQLTIVHSHQLGSLSDFCQTNKLIAQVMAMVAEERAVQMLLNELLGHAGSCIAVVSSSRYVHKDEQISFFEICLRAARFEEIAIGYQMRSSLQCERTVLNPPNKTEQRSWDSYDIAILQGQEESEERMSMIATSGAMSRAAAEDAKAYRLAAAEAANREFKSEADPKYASSASEENSRRSYPSATHLRMSFEQLASVGIIEEGDEAKDPDMSRNSQSSTVARTAWATALQEFDSSELTKMQEDLKTVQDALMHADDGEAYEPDSLEQIAVVGRTSSEAMGTVPSASFSKAHSLKAGIDSSTNINAIAFVKSISPSKPM